MIRVVENMIASLNSSMVVDALSRGKMVSRRRKKSVDRVIFLVS